MGQRIRQTKDHSPEELPSAGRHRPGLTILLDVMETLVTEPFYREMPAFFEMSFEQFKALKHPTSWAEFEEGRITESEYFRRCFRDGRRIDGQALRAHMKSAYRWLEGTEALLEELRSAGYPMHALSNYPVWYRLIEEQLGLSRYLEWTFVSCLTGFRKPASEAFLNAARTLGVPPPQCLFIDDRPVNIEAARAIGMQTILRRDSAQLRQQLQRLGVLDD